ncbi:MAG: hypothetical protein DLM53_11270 [Candidatus Eremiobacter antarcticus]|nr:MAG: hypothetical protein DLM53_11270 [Candidatus Eremiobacter sp. RRmetagenome_bin22]
MDLAAVDRQSAPHRVVFAVYRDGDNNLDEAQERNVTDFVKSTAQNPALKVIAEDTTALPKSPFPAGALRSEWSVIQNGQQHVTRVTPPVDMSNRRSLSNFVEQTLETRFHDPQFRHADVWIDLVDHGGGDGGGLQADISGGFMGLQDIAGAIADGRAQFNKKCPQGDDSVTGVLANQCLMATVGFADALSHSGVRYLAASPETMIAPGVPSAKFADVLTRNDEDWAQQAVDVTMKARYGGVEGWHPAAAFDVLDLDAGKVGAMRSAVTSFNDAVDALPHSQEGRETLRDIRSDVRSVRGMVRFDHSKDMPWHADRPAIATYETVAGDERLPQAIRGAAQAAAQEIGGIVLAHEESLNFGPFHASYADAVGPTAHLPVSKASYDSWADRGVVETHNDFYDAVHGADFSRSIGAYNRLQDAAGALA